MTPWPRASVAIAGSGVAFPTCTTPWGAVVSRIETHALFELLTPEMSPERRAPVAAHMAESIGIESRAWAHWIGAEPRDDETDSVALAIDASRAALDSAGIAASEIGAVVLATSTPPRWTSASSASVAGAIGAVCPFFDVRSGCAGGLYAIALAATFAASAKRPVLAIGTDTFSKIVPPGERFATLSMGDGAAALVIVPSVDSEFEASFGGNGALHHLTTVPGAMPPRTLAESAWRLSGDPARFAEEAEKSLLQALANATERAPSRPAMHIVHAGRRGVCERVSRTIDAEIPCWTQTISQHGNLGAASVAAALHESRKTLAKNDVIAIASVGGGPSFGGAYWRNA